MIIKLVGADFSANNIGKVALKREVSDATKSLLSNYTRSLTTKQQLAVEDFILGLKSNGLWASIGNLYIQALAGNLNETMFNIKTETKDTTPSSEYYLLENNGLRTKYYSTNTTIPSDSRAIVKMNASYMNLHYMVYVSKLENDTNSKWTSNYYMTTYNSTVYKGMKVEYNAGNQTWNAIINGNPTRYAQAYKNEYVEGFVGVSCQSDGKVIGVTNNTAGNLGVSEDVDTTISDVNTYIGCSVQGYANCSNPMRIITMGSGLSSDQLLKYNELCDALISKICA